MIPKDWSEIDIELFVKLYPTFKDKGLDANEIIENKQLQLSLIKNISFEDAEYCLKSEAIKVKELLDSPIPKKIVKYFKLNGVTYRFNTSANELDSSGYIGVMNAIKEDPIKNMHLSIFNLATPVKYSWLRSKWVSYDFKPSEVIDRINDFKRMPINIAYPIAVFFLTLSKDLTNVTQDYLSQSLMKMEKEINATKEDLQNMVGQ